MALFDTSRTTQSSAATTVADVGRESTNDISPMISPQPSIASSPLLLVETDIWPSSKKYNELICLLSSINTSPFFMMRREPLAASQLTSSSVNWPSMNRTFFISPPNFECAITLCRINVREVTWLHNVKPRHSFCQG